MDNIFKLLENHPRRLKSNFRLELLGYHAQQPDWVKATYIGCNFSIILSGSGSYTHLGKTYAVNAPCVLIQWPDEPAEYGPDEGTSWEELYIVYPADFLTKLIDRKLFNRQKPFWQFGNKQMIQPLIYDLLDRLADVTPSTELDAIDMQTEAIVMHTLLNEYAPLKKSEEIIQTIIKEVQTNPAAEYNFDILARNHGMSPATFRRRWIKQAGLPPGKFHIQKKIEEACRLLTETRLTINAIAEHLNFADVLYFRRRFKIETGYTATQYRTRNIR